MREFFKGRRRKIGCVLLAMAVMSTGGWGRSLSTGDEFAVRILQRMHSFGSESGSVSWWAWHEPLQSGWSVQPMGWKTWELMPIDWNTRDPWTFPNLFPAPGVKTQRVEKIRFISWMDKGSWPIRRRFDWQELAALLDILTDATEESLATKLNSIPNIPAAIIKKWEIPYWSLVLPLTLVSAYLILWKPRKRAAP